MNAPGQLQIAVNLERMYASLVRDGVVTPAEVAPRERVESRPQLVVPRQPGENPDLIGNVSECSTLVFVAHVTPLFVCEWMLTLL